MADEEVNNKDVQNTMNIILNAGDARVFIAQALDAAGEFDYKKAEELIEKANKKLVVAHRLQTAKIQQEAEGEHIDYSVLFTHAQDTLMTINSEFKLVKHLLKVFEERDKELDKRIENKVSELVRKEIENMNN